MALSRRSAIRAPEPKHTLTPEGQVRWDLIVAGIAVLVIIIDQITKALIHARFAGSHVFDVVPIIGNNLTLVFDKNKGAAFSSFTNSPVLLGLLIFIAVGVIAYMYWMNRSRDYPLLKVTFGLIAGGAVGNLIDRVRLGYVTDFIHFQLPSLHFDFAIFNIADSAISIGIVSLAYVFWTLPREAIPGPGEDAPSDASTTRQPLATPATPEKPPTSSATKVSVHPAKSAKTPASAITKSPTLDAPVATTTRTGSRSKNKSKRRS